MIGEIKMLDSLVGRIMGRRRIIKISEKMESTRFITFIWIYTKVFGS